MKIIYWWIIPVMFGGNEAVSQGQLKEETTNEVSEGSQDYDVKFRLFTSENPTVGLPISAMNSTEYLREVFKIRRPLKMIVHGWLSSEESTVVKDIAEAYVKTKDVYAIRVDWSDMAGWRVYPMSVLNVATVGAIVGGFVELLVKNQLVDLKDVHLIGHSLGAHVMGIAGSTVKSGKVARITGLDPARPGYEYVSYEYSRLDKADADFVDVIHTAGSAAGYYYPLGHVDFYPNGGTPPQPGCFELTNPTKLVGCSHSRAYEFYCESISSEIGFRAVKCETWNEFSSGACNKSEAVYMGDPTPPSARGIFYLATNDSPPYAKG